MDVETFCDRVASVVLLAHKQRRWQPNWPHITAVGESIGVTDTELEIGGDCCNEILRRVGEVSALVAGHDIAHNSTRAAEIAIRSAR